MIETIAAAGEYGGPASQDWRALDWSTHERDAAIGGRRVRYVDIGEGAQACVLVHGLGGCWQHWSQTIPALARHGRVIALDLPGFGASQRAAGPVSLDGFADTAAELCGALGLERVVFFGHSMGGPIALRFASRHPELARALVLVAGALYEFTALLGLREVAHYVRLRPSDAAAVYTEALSTGMPMPAAFARSIVASPRLRRLILWPYLHEPAALPARATALVLHGAGARGVFPTVRALGRVDPCAGLADVRCPILSIGARHDRISPPADLARLDAQARGAKSVLIEGAGHMLMLERPQELNAQVERFLGELSR